jgi:hypothetical protein
MISCPEEELPYDRRPDNHQEYHDYLHAAMPER